jgi:hypothetical protein
VAERPTHAIDVRPPISARDLSEMLGTKAREILEHFPASSTRATRTPC